MWPPRRSREEGKARENKNERGRRNRGEREKPGGNSEGKGTIVGKESVKKKQSEKKRTEGKLEPDFDCTGRKMEVLDRIDDKTIRTAIPLSQIPGFRPFCQSRIPGLAAFQSRDFGITKIR